MILIVFHFNINLKHSFGGLIPHNFSQKECVEYIVAEYCFRTRTYIYIFIVHVVGRNMSTEVPRTVHSSRIRCNSLPEVVMDNRWRAEQKEPCPWAGGYTCSTPWGGDLLAPGNGDRR